MFFSVNLSFVVEVSPMTLMMRKKRMTPFSPLSMKVGQLKTPDSLCSLPMGELTKYWQKGTRFYQGQFSWILAYSVRSRTERNFSLSRPFQIQDSRRKSSCVNLVLGYSFIINSFPSHGQLLFSYSSCLCPDSLAWPAAH